MLDYRIQNVVRPRFCKRSKISGWRLQSCWLWLSFAWHKGKPEVKASCWVLCKQSHCHTMTQWALFTIRAPQCSSVKLCPWLVEPTRACLSNGLCKKRADGFSCKWKARVWGPHHGYDPIKLDLQKADTFIQWSLHPHSSTLGDLVRGKLLSPWLYNATPKIFDLRIDTSNILPPSNTVFFCSNHTINNHNKIVNALDLSSDQFKNT